MNLSNLTTEKRNKNTEQIDAVSTFEMLKMINNEDKTVSLAVEKELSSTAEAIDQITKCIKKGGRLVYVGSGTSGRLGVLDASECPPTYGVGNDLVVGIIAGGDRALRYPIEGAEDSKELGVEDLKKINFSKDDALVGISSSGRTPYVIAALEYANSIGACTISLSCTENSKITEIAKIKINPIVGPEVITGSTRMKSGTAQKLVLNMITTGLMIKLGKVYGNLMVDVQPSNEKLQERQISIVIEATSCFRNEAISALKKSLKNSKVAIVMILLKISASDANALLEQNDGYIRKVLSK